MTQLPAEVVDRDRRLQSAGDELRELRWHWTLDKSNPDRVSGAEYARQVGAGHQTVNRSAASWADYLTSRSGSGAIEPGKPQTAGDFEELRRLNDEQRLGAEAIARATGAQVGNVARSQRADVEAVVNIARERATSRGTTVEHEIDRAAERRETMRKVDKQQREEKQRRRSMRYLSIEGDIANALRKLRHALTESEGVEFDAEERELLADSIGKLRALLNLIDVRVTGAASIDWDAEFAKLGDPS